MQRPIWEGHISFGLVNIPVLIFSAEQKSDLHFKLIDARNNARIRYERINEQTGEEVPWSSIAKAYELKKGNFVILKDEDFEKAAIENLKVIEIDGFIEEEALESIYFDKPYYLVPDKGGEKGYSLLREILEENHKIGIAKIIIRTRPHITAIYPYQNLLLLHLLHYVQELRTIDSLPQTTQDIKKQSKISTKEKSIASQLVDAMTMPWKPEDYHDEYRETLMKVIEQKSKTKGRKITTQPKTQEKKTTGKVIDFVSLLQKSLKDKKTSPASKKRTKH